MKDFRAQTWQEVKACYRNESYDRSIHPRENKIKISIDSLVLMRKQKYPTIAEKSRAKRKRKNRKSLKPTFTTEVF